VASFEANILLRCHDAVGKLGGEDLVVNPAVFPEAKSGHLLRISAVDQLDLNHVLLLRITELASSMTGGSKSM